MVYLHASIAQQVERTAKDRNRPLLQAENPSKVLTDLMAVRDPIYRSLCDLVVETDGRKVLAVTREIMSRLDESAAATD